MHFIVVINDLSINLTKSFRKDTRGGLSNEHSSSKLRVIWTNS